MRFEWDKTKRLANHEKHGLDFNDALELFKGEMVLVLDQRRDYGEDGFIGFGVSRQWVFGLAFSRRKAGCYPANFFEESQPERAKSWKVYTRKNCMSS